MHDEWAKRIAEARSKEELINHFREHVGEHYLRHNQEGELSIKAWLANAICFLYLLEKKFPKITKKDLLYLMSKHDTHITDGPEAPFDVNKYIKEYDGDIKKIYEDRENSK